MKSQTSFGNSEKIDIAEKRITELQTMINHWRVPKNINFWDSECSKHPSSPSCLLFDN